MSDLVRVKMKTSMAGPHGSCGVGKVCSVSQETADAWIEGGFAELFQPAPVAPVAEVAALDNDEVAVDQPPKKKRRGRAAN